MGMDLPGKAPELDMQNLATEMSLFTVPILVPTHTHTHTTPTTPQTTHLQSSHPHTPSPVTVTVTTTIPPPYHHPHPPPSSSIPAPTIIHSLHTLALRSLLPPLQAPAPTLLDDTIATYSHYSHMQMPSQ